MPNHNKNAMRLIATLLLDTLCASAYAAEPSVDNPRKDPAGKPSVTIIRQAEQTVIESAPVPPPPTLDANELVDEPQVTITKETEQTVEEYRAGGKLYMIKITPKVGKPYYLVDDRGDGKFARQESLDSGVRPPRWVIHSF